MLRREVVIMWVGCVWYVKPERGFKMHLLKRRGGVKQPIKVVYFKRQPVVTVMTCSYNSNMRRALDTWIQGTLSKLLYAG